ncbi:MAG: alpha/beta fold hydrolase [Kiritimatiellae bacterium]|jgi:pimeloyl-ACP methyl ester carboxylesterase|nr:alpha/beta fold hydrolase [Kiritimatiellia bacterium]
MSKLIYLSALAIAGFSSLAAAAAVTNDVAFTATLDASTQRYVEILPDGFNSVEPHDVLVCLHGHGSDRWQYVNLIRGETSAARDVARDYDMIFISPDYRATTSWMGPAAEADMLQILATLKTQYNVDRIIMTGASMGGSSSLTFTAMHPELVDGVVSLNGLADHVSYENFQDAIAESFGGTKAEVPEEYYNRSALYFPGRFTMPFAITAGGLDTSVPPDSVMQLAGMVETNNPRVRIDFVASRGHSTDYAASLAAYQFVVNTGAVTIVTNPVVIAYWDFNPAGNGTYDISDNGNTLVNIGVTMQDGAAIFNGSHTSFNTANPLNLTSYSDLTVECFICTTNTGSLMMLLEHSLNTGANPGSFFMDINEKYPGQMFGSFKTSTSWNIDQTTANATTDGVWHHVALVYNTDKTGADRSTLYLDGIKQGTYLSFADSTATTLRNEILYIGSRANTSFKFIGELDDLRISGSALEPDQFLQTRTSTPPAPFAYWRFDKGAPLTDSSGNGNTLTGSGVVFDKGSAILNGSQTVFSTLNTLDLSAFDNLTIECFIRTASTAKAIILEHSTAFYQNPGAFLIDVNESSTGDIMGGFCTATGVKLNIDISSAGIVADGEWHHTSIVYNKHAAGTDRSTLYVDGIAQGTYASWTDDSAVSFRNAAFYIGSRENNSMKFKGELDDIRITGAALTPAEFMKKRSYYGGTSIIIQ